MERACEEDEVDNEELGEARRGGRCGGGAISRQEQGRAGGAGRL